MDTTMNAEVNLIRHSETGNIVTTMILEHGMPDMFIIEQRIRGDLHQKVSFTLREAKYLRCVIGQLLDLNEDAGLIDKPERETPWLR